MASLTEPTSPPRLFTAASLIRESDKTFHLFPTLPAELRLQIWGYAAKRTRYIRTLLRQRWLTEALLERSDETRPESHADAAYDVVVDGYQTIIVLFRVSTESRAAAMASYRVHLPCWLKGRTDDNTNCRPGVFYFDPENDVLSLSYEGGRPGDTNPLAHFLHDLKHRYDPRRVGLKNLAINDTEIGRLSSICQSTVDQVIRKSLIETLAQLRQVFFVCSQAAGRLMLGTMRCPPTTGATLNMALPIMGAMPAYTRAGPDPRMIKEGLEQVLVYRSPRPLVQAWRRLIREMLGDRVVVTQQKVLLGFRTGGNLYDRADAEEMLLHERQIWESEPNEKLGGTLDQELDVTTGAAIGFWLFDTNAFGDLPEDLDDPGDRPWMSVLDLRRHRPELVLMSVSGA